MVKSPYKIACLSVVLWVIAFYSCSNKDNGKNPIATLNNSPVQESWKGSYSTSLCSLTTIELFVTHSTSGLEGTYTCANGNSGTISGKLTGDSIIVTLLQQTVGCTGTFTGAGCLNGDTLIVSSFSGADCKGNHSNGYSELLKWSPPTGIFPHGIGSYWVYADTSYDSTGNVLHANSIMVMIADTMTVQYRNTFYRNAFVVSNKNSHCLYWEDNNGSIWLFGGTDMFSVYITTKSLEIKYPVVAGETWAYDLLNIGDYYSIYTTVEKKCDSTNTTYFTENGVFRVVIYSYGFSDFRDCFYYSSGIGLVGYHREVNGRISKKKALVRYFLM
ncbi:MAG: hypothetical protein V1913_07375 [Fibrobacterota bacterium]